MTQLSALESLDTVLPGLKVPMDLRVVLGTSYKLDTAPHLGESPKNSLSTSRHRPPLPPPRCHRRRQKEEELVVAVVAEVVVVIIVVVVVVVVEVAAAAAAGGG